MDRPIVYPNALVTDTDTLTLAKAAMVGLGFAMQAVLGTSTVVDGLACTPASGLAVQVGAGSIYALMEADGAAYGSLGTDVGQIVKQGLVRAATTLSTPAPATSGQSICYLIEAQYQDADSGPELLAYYDSANPSVPFTGPGGDGQAQNTLRQGLCALQVKAGTAAATGSQTAPAADAGWVGLWVVTVASGQGAIVSGDIAEAAGAPFLATKLPQALSTLGGTVTGALTVDGVIDAVGGLAAAVGLSTVSANGVNGLIAFDTGVIGNASVRWEIQKNGDMESGGNTGSNFSIIAFSDAGQTLYEALHIDRASGLMEIEGAGGLSVTGPASFSDSITVGGPRATFNTGADFQQGFSVAGQPAAFNSGLEVTAGAVTLPAGSLALDYLPQAPAETVLANLTGASAYPAAYTMAQLLAAMGVVIPTYAQFRNQQTSGTASGESLSGAAWTTRALGTTVTNGISGATLSGNQIALPAGSYNVSAYGLAQAGANVSAQNHKLRLRNATDGATLVSGVNNAYAGGSNTAVVIAALQGQFTLAAAKTVELDSYVLDGSSGGPVVGSGEAEVYADILLTKIA